MPDLLSQLNAISDLQGKPRIDSSRIEGFGEGHPPSPGFPPEPPEFPMDDDGKDLGESYAQEPYVDPPPPSQPPSPLIALGRAEPPEPPRTPQVPSQGLFVAWLDGMPCQGSYQGRAVDLTDKERGAVVKVVLQAIARTVRAQLQEVEAMLPKRRRRRAIGVAATKPRGEPSGMSAGFESPAELAGSSPAPVVTEYPGKRRGRPKKVQA